MKLDKLNQVSIQQNNIESVEGFNRMQLKLIYLNISNRQNSIGSNSIMTIRDICKSHWLKLENFVLRKYFINEDENPIADKEWITSIPN